MNGLHVDDLTGIKSIESPVINPDRETILNTLGTMNLKENKIENNIHNIKKKQNNYLDSLCRNIVWLKNPV